MINPIKLVITKKSCKNVNDKILLSKLIGFLKFFIEKKIINKEQLSPRIKEYDPIKLAKFISPQLLLSLLGAYSFHHV